MTHSEAKSLTRTIDRLDLYKRHPPQSPDDWQEIIDVATKLLKAAGAK